MNTNSIRSVRLSGINGQLAAMVSQHRGTNGLIRLVQVFLALYLLPVLMIVLMVGGVGLLILTVARVFTVLFGGPFNWPDGSVGPSSR